jgi:hypothetical protein
VAKMREKKEQASVVSSVFIKNDKEVKSLRNREEDEEARRCNRAESKYFAASFRSEPNDDSSVLTGPCYNQPIAPVSRREIFAKPLENWRRSEPKRRRYGHGRSQLGRQLFRCCHSIETNIQLVEPGESRSKISTIVPLSCGRGTTRSTSSRVCVVFSIASRQDHVDRQANAKCIPQQSAELSGIIPRAKIISDGEWTTKDTSCPVLTCDGDIATIIAKGVSYFTVQGVPKMRESTSTPQARKNREGELRPVQVEVREKKCNGVLAKSDTKSATTTNRRRSRYRAAAILSETNTGPSDALQKISRRSNTVTGSESALQISGGSNNETGSADASQISGGSNDKTGCADDLVTSGG